MSRINYVFLDFENNQETDWERIVGRPVKVVLVYGQQKRYLEIAAVKHLLATADRIELVESKKSGKNAADLLIAERIGELKVTDPKGYYHIVSRDKGFDSLVEDLRAKGILAARRHAFAEIPVLMNLEERVVHFAKCLKQNSNNRPGKLAALQSQIQVNFGKALSPDEVGQIVSELIKRGTLLIDDKGKVTYRA